MTMRMGVHLLASRRGYRTIAASSDVTPAEQASLEALVFGQSSDARFLASLDIDPAVFLRILPGDGHAGRFGITRIFAGHPDEAGRATLELRTLLMSREDYASIVRSDLDRFLAHGELWHRSHFESGRELTLPEVETMPRPPVGRRELMIMDAWLQTLTQPRSTAVLADGPESRRLVLSFLRVLSLEDLWRCRWGLRLLTLAMDAQLATAPAALDCGTHRLVPIDLRARPTNRAIAYFLENHGLLEVIPASSVLCAAVADEQTLIESSRAALAAVPAPMEGRPRRVRAALVGAWRWAIGRSISSSMPPPIRAALVGAWRSRPQRVLVGMTALIAALMLVVLGFVMSSQRSVPGGGGEGAESAEAPSTAPAPRLLPDPGGGGAESAEAPSTTVPSAPKPAEATPPAPTQPASSAQSDPGPTEESGSDGARSSMPPEKAMSDGTGATGSAPEPPQPPGVPSDGSAAPSSPAATPDAATTPTATLADRVAGKVAEARDSVNSIIQRAAELRQALEDRSSSQRPPGRSDRWSAEQCEAVIKAIDAFDAAVDGNVIIARADRIRQIAQTRSDAPPWSSCSEFVDELPICAGALASLEAMASDDFRNALRTRISAAESLQRCNGAADQRDRRAAWWTRVERKLRPLAGRPTALDETLIRRSQDGIRSAAASMRDRCPEQLDHAAIEAFERLTPRRRVGRGTPDQSRDSR